MIGARGTWKRATKSTPRSYLISYKTHTSSVDYARRYSDLVLRAVDSGKVRRRLQDCDVSWTAARVLDLGSGPGAWAIALRDLGAGPIVCHDISSVFLESSRELHKERKLGGIEYVRRDLTELPYRDESFDVVICNRALYHSSDEEWTIREISRVLSPGGAFYLESHSWRWMIQGYRGSVWWRIIAGLAPVFPIVFGRKLIPTIYAWCWLTHRRATDAGLVLEKHFDSGHDEVFSSLYRKATTVPPR